MKIHILSSKPQDPDPTSSLINSGKVMTPPFLKKASPKKVRISIRGAREPLDPRHLEEET